MDTHWDKIRFFDFMSFSNFIPVYSQIISFSYPRKLDHKQHKINNLEQ